MAGKLTSEPLNEPQRVCFLEMVVNNDTDINSRNNEPTAQKKKRAAWENGNEKI